MTLRIRNAIAPAADWLAENPILLPGELGIEQDAAPARFKLGDGASRWLELPYFETVGAEWGSVTGSLSDQADLQGALDGKAPSSHTHLLASITDAGELAAKDTVEAGDYEQQSVTNAILANMTGPTFKLRASGTGAPQDGTPATARAMLNVEDGANRTDLMPPIRFAWTDFFNTGTNRNDPFEGSAILDGSLVSAPSATYTALTAGVLGLESGASAGSGYSWLTTLDRCVPAVDLFFRGKIVVLDDFTAKTIRIGFLDTSSSADATDGTYFEIDSTGAATPKAAANGATSTATAFTLTADTYYVLEVYWVSTSTIQYRVLSEDESAVHLDETVKTNIPSGNSRRFGFGCVATSSGTVADRLCALDHMGGGFKGTR